MSAPASPEGRDPAVATFADAERTGAHRLEGDDAGAHAPTLDDWQDRVASLWPFDASNYPMLRQGGGQTADALQHIALHQAKDAGKIAATVESADHGREIDYRLLERAARNTLVNGLRLCALLGVQASALLDNYAAEVGPAQTDQAPARERSERDSEADAEASAARPPHVSEEGTACANCHDPVHAFQIPRLEGELAAARQEAETLKANNERLQQTLALYQGPHVTMTVSHAAELEQAEEERDAARQEAEEADQVLINTRLLAAERLAQYREALEWALRTLDGLVSRGGDGDAFAWLKGGGTRVELVGYVAKYEAARDVIAASPRDLSALEGQAALDEANNEVVRVRAALGAAQEALREIAKGEGAFSRDPLTHAGNTIDNMKALARAALAASPTPPGCQPVERADAGARVLCAEWKRLLGEATPGPWEVWEHQSELGALEWDIRPRDQPFNDFSLLDPRDATLIVWMRNHAREIIAALEGPPEAQPFTRGFGALPPEQLDARRDPEGRPAGDAPS